MVVWDFFHQLYHYQKNPLEDGNGMGFVNGNGVPTIGGPWRNPYLLCFGPDVGWMERIKLLPLVPNNLTEGTSNWNSSLDDLVDDRKENSFLKESCLSFLTAPSSRGAIFGSVSGCQPSPSLRV